MVIKFYQIAWNEPQKSDRELIEFNPFPAVRGLFDPIGVGYLRPHLKHY